MKKKKVILLVLLVLAVLAAGVLGGILLHDSLAAKRVLETLTVEEFETRLTQYEIPSDQIPGYFLGDGWTVCIKNIHDGENHPLLLMIGGYFQKDGEEDFYFNFAKLERFSRADNYNMKFTDELQYAETVQAGSTPVYLMEYTGNRFELLWFSEGGEYRIIAQSTLETMRAVAETVA